MGAFLGLSQMCENNSSSAGLRQPAIEEHTHIVLEEKIH